jgi:hypothetical protein
MILLLSCRLTGVYLIIFHIYATTYLWYGDLLHSVKAKTVSRAPLPPASISKRVRVSETWNEANDASETNLSADLTGNLSAKFHTPGIRRTTGMHHIRAYAS